MPLLPGFLLCQLAYEPSETGYLAGWMLTRSLALPLRTRLDGTTINLASYPNQRLKSSHQQTENSSLEVPKWARGLLSPEIGDRWRLSPVISHLHYLSSNFPPRVEPTRA